MTTPIILSIYKNIFFHVIIEENVFLFVSLDFILSY